MPGQEMSERDRERPSPRKACNAPRRGVGRCVPRAWARPERPGCCRPRRPVAARRAPVNRRRSPVCRRPIGRRWFCCIAQKDHWHVGALLPICGILQCTILARARWCWRPGPSGI